MSTDAPPLATAEPTAARESLSAVDAAWLRMDSPTNPMVITSVLGFDAPLEFAAVEAVVRDRLLRHPRFRQRPVDPRLGVGPGHWERDPDFDLRAHLHHYALPAPGDQAAFEDLVSDLMSTPLDHGRPLWQLYVIDHVAGGTALVARVHHAMADGVALVGVLLGVTDEGAGLAGQQQHAPNPHATAAPPRDEMMLQLARRGVDQAVSLGRMLLLPADPPTCFKGRFGVVKRAAWSRPIPLAEVKTIAHAAGAKANDVLLAAVTGALRDYLDARDAWQPGLEVRALVPVNLRRDEDQDALGNRFGLVFVPLALGETDPRALLRETRARMDTAKNSPDATVAMGVLGAMGAASPEIEQMGVELFSRKATLLVTNVPGPPAALHLAGRALSSVMVWAPVAGRIGLGVSLLSYNGSVRAGVAADARLVPDPAAIVAAIERHLGALHAAIVGA